MRHYVKYIPGFLVGALLAFFAAQALGILPIQINYCGERQANYQNCPAHYLITVPFIWIINHLEVVAAILTGIATAFIAHFTRTLKESTDLLAKIANATATAQERDTKILQRAYIVVEPYGIDTYNDGKRLVGYIGIKNAGRLPATELKWFTRLSLGTSMEWNETKDETLEGNNILAPGTVMREGSRPIVLQKIQSMGSDTRYLYVWGAVQYIDGFQKEVRVTRFCHRYNWARHLQTDEHNIPRFRIIRKAGRHHIHGNSAD
jgi:archaellum component FlaG (FlaF/FlaG flagellin family)